MSRFSLAETAKRVHAIVPQVGAAITGDYVSLKNVTGPIDIAIDVAQGNAATMAITIEQASVVAGTDSKVITEVVPIWANEDTAASDSLVRQTDAVGFTLSAAVKNKMVIFRIDPATLDLANGFDCITVKTAASHADNITSAVYVLGNLRYSQATPPSAITD